MKILYLDLNCLSLESKFFKVVNMNRKLFFTLIISSIGFANAQLTQSNEPQVGESVLLYVCDSAYTNASSINGDGVTWDFSDIKADAQATTKTMSVATSSNTDFYGASYVSEIPDFISTFWSSDANTRTSYGFIFKDPSIGDIIISFSSNQELLMNYPFDLNGSLTDTYSGTLTNQQMASTGTSCTGNITSEIDGRGTLILASDYSNSNVLRHKVSETTSASITLPGVSLSVPASVSRVQYDYYDLSYSKFPIFSHIKISYDATIVNGNFTLVLSSVEPSSDNSNPPSTAGIEEFELPSFDVYPVPSSGLIHLETEGDDGIIQIIDPNGREMYRLKTVSGESHYELDLTSLDSGIYFIKVIVNGKVAIKRIVIE